MEMSNVYMPELHVAQQRRRDKLRVQQLEDLHTNNFHPHDNNNPSSLVFPSEILNFTSSTAFPNIHPSRFVAPSSSGSCDPQPLQSCDNWVTSYDDNRRRDLMVSQFVAHVSNCNPTSTGEMLAPHRYYPNHVHNWEHGGNELALLPSFLGQATDASAHQAHHHGLSLSLSSNQISEMHCLGEPLELKPLESGSISSIVKVDSRHNQLQNAVGSSSHMGRNVGPLGPFTGYTTILESSKFLKPAQQLLDEFFSGAGLRRVRGCEEDDSMTASRSTHNSSDCLNANFRSSNDFSAGGGSYRPDCHERKAKLLHMQEEVCKQHKQYHEQMEMVISAFETVPGLSNATPYISRSLMTISRHFRYLKIAIADQIMVIKRAIGDDLSPTSFVKGECSSSQYDHNFAKVKSGSVVGTGYGDHQNHIWRPQRGLPDRAVSILRAWLFDHFLHPYPTDSDKQMLASQTGLSRNQVSNWFINARVRLWKPMVEEIHMLETKGTGRSETNANNRQATENRKSGHKPSVDALCDTKPLDRLASSASGMEGSSRGEATTEQLFQKCSRMEQHQMPNGIDGAFVRFLPYQRRGLEIGGIGAVSLTLGLRHGSETSHQQQLQHTFNQQGMHFGGHIMHDFSG